MEGTSYRPPSSNEMISSIRNDPNVYMDIRPARNSNACTSCRKKKKKCESPSGPGSTCKRCSEYGWECKYERTLGQQSMSPSPPTSTPSLSPSPSLLPRAQMQRDNAYSRIGVTDGTRSQQPGSGAGSGLARSHEQYATPGIPFSPSAYMGDFQSPMHSQGTSIHPQQNTQRTHSDFGPGSFYHSQGQNMSYQPINHRPSTAPQLDSFSGATNSFTSDFSFNDENAYPSIDPADFARLTPAETCAYCTPTSLCYVHTMSSQEASQDWASNPYFYPSGN